MEEVRTGLLRRGEPAVGQQAGAQAADLRPRHRLHVRLHQLHNLKVSQRVMSQAEARTVQKCGELPPQLTCARDTASTSASTAAHDLCTKWQQFIRQLQQNE